MSCLICGSSADIQPSIPHIITAFRAMLELLESQAQKCENDSAMKLQKLKSQLDDASSHSIILESEKKVAEKRSDLYKQKFLDAQKAIEILNEKNAELTSQKSPSQDMRNFPFPQSSKPKPMSPETKKLILAPDTYAPEMVHEDITYISSDEDDFKSPPKVKTTPKHSPLNRVKKTSPKALISSFFARPSSPIHTVRKKKPSSETSVSDLDETRLDCGNQKDSMGMDFTEYTKMDEDVNSIPPSPILSAGKGRKRFGSFIRNRGSIPKYKGYSAKEKNSPKHCAKDQESHKNLPTKSNDKDLDDSQPFRVDDLPKDSLQLHHMKQNITLHTSLDELFDKTDGNLETTTMMLDMTMNDSKDEKDNDDEMTDDELDALLLEGIEEESFESPEQSKLKADRLKQETEIKKYQVPKPLMEDSFDVLPKKSEEKDFKYHEVVRKKNEREKLNAKACAQCEAYYSDLPEEERAEIMKKVCRHKHVHAPPSTPDHFWEIGIPSTMECKRRGYIVNEADLPPEERTRGPRMRRKKPLEPYFSKKT